MYIYHSYIDLITVKQQRKYEGSLLDYEGSLLDYEEEGWKIVFVDLSTNKCIFITLKLI